MKLIENMVENEDIPTMTIGGDFHYRPELRNCTQLVLVCCHATYTGDGSDTGEDQWVLQPFQRSNPRTGKPSEHETFIAHILAGALAVENRPEAVLMFSGGMTHESAFTEAEGYEKVFQSLGGNSAAVKRYDLENWATDSYQNLLFSILRFRQLTSHYPDSITVITHAFKERRFLKLHAPAIKWPPHRIRVQGINPPFNAHELEQTKLGELERAYELFVKDPYGMSSELAEKRRARNWKVDMLERLWQDVEDEVQDLLVWDGGPGGQDIFPKTLPWELNKEPKIRRPSALLETMTWPPPEDGVP